MEYIDTGKCIWCKLEKPVVSFGKKPHIIPHALNANYIGTDICNKCNTLFGTSTSNKPSVDLVFKEVFNAFRFFGQKLTINSYKTFKSVYFKYEHSKNIITVKNSFLTTTLTRQFKRGLFEIFLQYYHDQTHGGNNPIFDPIRDFARYDKGNLRVYYLKADYILKPVREEDMFVLPMSEVAIAEVFSLGIYRFHFFGHFFYLEIIPELFNINSKKYFQEQTELLVKAPNLMGEIIELTDILEVDMFMQRFHKRKICFKTS